MWNKAGGAAQSDMARTDTSLRLVQVSRKTVHVSEKTAWIFVRAILSDGTEGFGEASDFANTVSVEADLDLLAAVVAETHPQPMGPVLDLLGGRHVSVARRAARSGVEAALLDAMARRAGVPLTALLGGPYRNGIPVYANINRGIADRTPEGFAARARQVIADEGYVALKIAPFDGYLWDRTPETSLLEAGLARVAAVRDAVGPEVRILIDCHQRFSPADSAVLMREVAPLDPFWIEDPVDVARVGAREQRALRTLAHRHGMRVAGGEGIATLDDARRLLVDGAYDVILPDLRTTGVRPGLSILDLAVASGVEASLHNPAGPALDAVSRHVAAAAPSFLILERQVRESPLYDALSGGGQPVSEGRVGLGTGPGLGLDLDWEADGAPGAERPGRLSFSGLPGAGGDS
jgi:galactonate dehydratase